jgi:hypothetical protein
VCEAEAVKLLRGVGSDREWWWWNARQRIGHLRVGLTEAENEALPCFTTDVLDDAGESGRERRRTP